MDKADLHADRFNWSVDEAALAEARLFDGKLALLTNAPDTHVVEAAPHRPGEAMPCLRLAVVAFRAPAVALIEPIVLRAPSLSPATGAQERGMANGHLARDIDALMPWAYVQQVKGS